MISNIILLLVFLVLVILAGLFAGGETGIYQLSRLRLRLGIEKKHFLYTTLGKSLSDAPALLVSLLIGTNLAHYLATSTITYMILGYIQEEHGTELLATLITAPIFFIFSEVIPKNLFFYRADLIMPYISPFIFFSHRLFTLCGIVPLLKSILRVSSGVAKMSLITAHTAPIKAILLESQEEGFLSTVQIEIMKRLETISTLSILSVMTPLSQTEMANVKSNRTDLLKKLEKSAFTHLLVYDGWPENIIGFVNIYKAIGSKKHFTDLYNFTDTITKLSEYTSVSEAMNIMQRQGEKIVLVVKGLHSGREKPLGIVTMKDLAEELFGELTEW